MKKLGILTSGGDAPGMNAVIRACVRTAIHQNYQVCGIVQGYQGILDQNFLPLDLRSVANIIQRGGTVLKSGRCPAMLNSGTIELALENLLKAKFSALVVIGGDGSLSGALALDQSDKLKISGVPATIDNDVTGTDYTIGFDTAVNTALSSIDRIRDTAASHDSVFIVEVMGRNSGFLAAQVGLAGGAEAVFVPEHVLTVEAVSKKLVSSMSKGKKSSILIAAEGQKPGRAYDLAESLRKKSGIEPKVCILGHTQRGGKPSARDRILGSQMGAAAVNALSDHKYGGCFIGVQRGTLVEVPFAEVKKPKQLDSSLLTLTDILSM